MKKKNGMWPYILDVIAIAVGAVVITLGLLLLVHIFETYNVHVPGSREMWIGLIGAILGGAYTLLGVQITIRRQKDFDVERQRLESMPILHFKTYRSCLKNYGGQGIFTLCGDEFFTTATPENELDNYPIIEISLASSNPAFDVRIDSCMTTEHEKIPKQTECYFPQEHRLVNDEKIQNMFWIMDYQKYAQSNIQGILRVAYADIFGNPYYQDISFTYDERMFDSDNMLCLDRVMSPILADKKAPDLLERVRKEYSYFCDKSKAATKENIGQRTN